MVINARQLKSPESDFVGLEKIMKSLVAEEMNFDNEIIFYYLTNVC